jgi:hypothetical protein
MLMSPSNDVQPQDAAGTPDATGLTGQGDPARHPLEKRLDVALDWAGKAAAFCVARLQQSSEFLFALVMTTIFYFPSLRNGSRDAGFLYGGDVLGFYWPYIAKLQSLLSRHQFVALDFSQFNASADFFLAANFFPCHPLFVVWSLLSSPETTTFQAAGRILVIALAIHSFIACYFTLRLLTKFFGLDFWTAAFAAAAFAFSIYAINAHGEPMFVFCASVVPWAAYAALDYEEHRGIRRLLMAAFPVLIGFLAGYIPLGIACLGISALIVGVRLFLLNDQGSALATRASRYFAALLPFCLGSVVAAPYLLEVFFFLKASPSASRASLFYSAHQLAEMPQSILRALSYRAGIPGPFNEFSITWGLIAIAVTAIFLLSSRTLDTLSRREWTILKSAGFVYAAIALSIFGHHSVVSDMVFYFIPQVGGMHIYQRFLLPGQLLFAVMIALMLKALIDARPVLGLRIAFALFTTAAFAVAFYVLHHPAPASSIGLNNYLVFELMLAALCMAALLVPDKTFAYVAAIALFALPALDVMYDRSQGGSTFEAQVTRHGVMLNEGLRRGVVDYLERFRSEGKDLIKYVDITPRWRKDGVETFPKAFPEFVLQDVALCPYSGWNFYLSSRADYMATIPYEADGCFHPDWERLRTSGADFVVALESDLPKVAPMTGKLGPSDTYKLPDGVVLAPLASSRLRSRPSEDALYDNGYVRVVRGTDDQLDSAANNRALNATARQSSEGGGAAARAVDGNTSGVFAEGSVTHTIAEPGAWLEIDLGTSQTIGSVRLWNRTEVAHRLNDYWLTITDTPADATQKAAILKEQSTPGLWQKRVTTIPRPSLTVDTSGAKGRYLRIQLARQTPSPENVLSLAEVEAYPPGETAGPTSSGDSQPHDTFQLHSFSSNDANTIKLDAESSEPVTVKYLLWNNPRLRYQLNGKTIVPSIYDGLAVIGLPPGRNELTITYHNRLLTMFWFGYLAYALFTGWAFVTWAMEAARTRTHHQSVRDRDAHAIPSPSA